MLSITSIDSPCQLVDEYDIVIPDTNVLLSYPFLIPSVKNPFLPSTASLDLNHKHIVIPSIVDNELNQLKDRRGSASMTAYNIIRRLEKVSEYVAEHNYWKFSLQGAFDLRNNIRIYHKDEETGEVIDFLFGYWCVPGDVAAPPFRPRGNDTDGKIIASALKLRETAWYKEYNEIMDVRPEVTILSNDYNVRFRARNFGLRSEIYSLVGMDAYSGRRTVKAPGVLIQMLAQKGRIAGQIWRQYMADEPPLSPNEFIVFQKQQPKRPRTTKKASASSNGRRRRKHGRPDKPQVVTPAPEEPRVVKSPSEQFNHVGRYDSKTDQIVALQYLDISPVVPENVGQAIHIEAMMNPEIGVVIVDDNPHYRSDRVAVVSYRMREEAFTDDIYDKFKFS